MKISPCYGCEDRHVLCHSKCTLYAQYKSNVEATNLKIKKNKRHVNCYKDYHIKQIEKWNKRCKK